ncbi:hypothetical protein [Streptomyces sp. NPDC000405]|uniref:hypothetical protein n=1 Tax=Streptomyces sp. NPDC000405 TaxID=3161033 RepID=UPI00398C999B
MSRDQHITGGIHISGQAEVTFKDSAVTAAEHSPATVGAHQEAVDEEELARRVLALVAQLRQTGEPYTVRAADDLHQAVTAPSRRWEQVLRCLTRAGQGVAVTTVLATEIQGLDHAVSALLS